MIHVCFALYDKTGTYSRFTGTAILSLFDNTKSKVTVHLLHDGTLTEDNRDKLIQIADRYGQLLKFYNVEELCADNLAEIYEQFPRIRSSHFSIATFYRFFITPLLLPQGIEKAIYLDSDIIVNLDIAEFWRVELGNKPLGVVPEIDNGVPVKEFVLLVKEGVVQEENLFNAGILLMNLRVLQSEETTILAGMKFISEHPQFKYFDQDVLNYCFSTSTLKLPIKFNLYVEYARYRNEWTIDKKIYHYANGKLSFLMDANDPYSQLFMDYFIKTPWVDDDTRAALTGGLPSRKNYYVSVVIPMFNAEKHISNCLDSLLIQTFQDFEVIVVDDCSTDNSVAVVESYMSKFNGRLKLTHTETNSGTDCFPRNIGLMLARGEYIQFIDSDDMILGTALETLYKAAILYDADVVYTSQHYMWHALDNIVLYKDGTSKKLFDVNTNLIIDDQSTNLSRLLLEPGEGNFHAAWTKFVRRDFMLRNKIFFANLPLAGDFVGVIEIYCHARRFLRISTPLYFYRTFNDQAMSRKARAPQEQVKHWFSSFVKFTKTLHELEKKHRVLAENPLYCLEASIKTFGWLLGKTYYARNELDREDIYEVLHDEFYKNSPDLLAVLLPFLFSSINEKGSGKYSALVNKFGLYFYAEIFVLIDKKMDKETIQILSVSDDNAKLTKPEWWQRNGTCHVIGSYVGELEIVAKAMVEGNVQIRLGGPWVQTPEDKSKRLPYWIDYTKLIVNDKLIFDTPTPAWNDRHYWYAINVKADEEIKLHIEWQPHRDNRLDIPTDIINKEIKTPPLKVAVPKSKIVKPLSKDDTARIDIKFVSGATHGDFQIFSVSDERAKVSKPGWYQRSGIGYVIQSLNGELTFRAKATVEGQIELNLRGLEVRSPEDWANGIAKRIPYWVDYTKLIVKGNTIIDERTPAWCDEPYRYNLDVKANEEVTVKVEWMPHRKTV